VAGDKESGGAGDLLNRYFQRRKVLLNLESVNRTRSDTGAWHGSRSEQPGCL
jgi:hypothetical protein